MCLIKIHFFISRSFLWKNSCCWDRTIIKEEGAWWFKQIWKNETAGRDKGRCSQFGNTGLSKEHGSEYLIEVKQHADYPIPLKALTLIRLPQILFGLCFCYHNYMCPGLNLSLPCFLLLMLNSLSMVKVGEQ